MISNQRDYKRNSFRHGLTFVEFMGCIVAMVGGVFLGSTYLGIDMKEMAIGVLAKADVVSPDFFKSQEEPIADRRAADHAKEAFVQAEDPDSIEFTPGSTNSEMIESQQDAPNSQASTTSTSVTEGKATEAERREATRAYWDALTQCMLLEAKSRSQGFHSAEEWQLYDYLTNRKNAHSQALQTLEKLDAYAVDERLLAHGRQVISWNASAVKLFERALSLLSDGPGAGIAGPFAQSWQSSATQIRMEESLIAEKHTAVASYLDHKYADLAPFIPAYKK